MPKAESIPKTNPEGHKTNRFLPKSIYFEKWYHVCNLVNFLEIMNSKFILREGGRGLLNVYVVFRGGLPNVYTYLQGGRGGQKWPKSCLRSKSMTPFSKGKSSNSQYSILFGREAADIFYSIHYTYSILWLVYERSCRLQKWPLHSQERDFRQYF